MTQAEVLGALGLGYLAIRSEMIWTAILSFYMVSSAINGFRTASALRIIERADQRAGLACPSCGAAPVVGRFWRCVCGAEVDLFEGEGRCSACQRVHTQVPCLSCGARSAKDSWPR